MDDLVKRADEVLKDVTPGPWKWNEYHDDLRPIWHCEMSQGCGYLAWDDEDRIQANARFIAAARELVPAMRDRIEADAKRIAELERSRDDWRDDYRTLEKAIVGDTGLSAMTLAAQARTFRPRAEAAEARIAELEAAANQARLALAGYVSAQSAINMLDAALGEKK